MFKLLPENNSSFGKTKANSGDARTPDVGWSFELMRSWIWSWQRIRKISPTQISLAQSYYSGLKWHYYRTHSPWMKELSSIKMQMPRKRQHKNRSIIYTLMRNCHSNPFQHYNYLRLSTGRILDETESCWEPRVRRKKKGNETMLRPNDTIHNVTKTLNHRWLTGYWREYAELTKDCYCKTVQWHSYIWGKTYYSLFSSLPRGPPVMLKAAEICITRITGVDLYLGSRFRCTCFESTK